MEFSSKFADKVVRLRHGKLDRIELLDQSTMKHNLARRIKFQIAIQTKALRKALAP